MSSAASTLQRDKKSSKSVREGGGVLRTKSLKLKLVAPQEDQARDQVAPAEVDGSVLLK